MTDKPGRSSQSALPRLRLTPYAWAKLLYLRDAGPTEVGGFGLSASGDLLLIEDVALVRQKCDWASVLLDDEAVADLFDRLVDQGRRPEEFGRIWLHTHPGASPQPSATDETTFALAFGGCNWAIMLIVARNGSSYARLKFGVGPGGSIDMTVEVDFSVDFPAADPRAWQAEYEACVETARDPAPVGEGGDRWLDSIGWDWADMLSP